MFAVGTLARLVRPISQPLSLANSCKVVDAAFGEILTTCSKAQWLIKNGERVLRAERRGGNILLVHKISTVQYEPLGVVSAVVSWNYRMCLSFYLSLLIVSRSIPQCHVSNYGRPHCWQRNRHQVL